MSRDNYLIVGYPTLDYIDLNTGKLAPLVTEVPPGDIYDTICVDI